MNLLKSKVVLLVVGQLLLLLVFIIDIFFTHFLTQDNIVLVEVIYIGLVVLFYFLTNYVDKELGYEKRKENIKNN